MRSINPKKKRYTRIIATLGPASLKEITLNKMAIRGMNVARINCSHGTEIQRQKMVDFLRAINLKYDHNVTVLIDLEGYRIRIGKMRKQRMLNQNETVRMGYNPEKDEDVIPFDFKEDVKTIKMGSSVFIDDGLLHLKVIGYVGNALELKVIQGGVLRERKGINIPNLRLQANIVTENDEKSIQFAIKNKAEKIAQSFVRNKKDIQRVVDVVRPQLPKCKIIAKIENDEGVRNIESIIDACDGVMVARGDLGVTVPLYKIPLIQKYIIRHSNRQKKFSITATQMLDSMIVNGRPTRAEVSDVANAILDGTDYVMLSGETAIGKYPSRCVQTMSQIVEYTERYNNYIPR